MKFFSILILITTFLFSKENVVISNHKKLIIKHLNTEVISFKSPNVNFYTMGIFVNKQLNNKNREEQYNALISIFSDIIKEL